MVNGESRVKILHANNTHTFYIYRTPTKNGGNWREKYAWNKFSTHWYKEEMMKYVDLDFSGEFWNDEKFISLSLFFAFFHIISPAAFNAKTVIENHHNRHTRDDEQRTIMTYLTGRFSVKMHATSQQRPTTLSCLSAASKIEEIGPYVYKPNSS